MLIPGDISKHHGDEDWKEELEGAERCCGLGPNMESKHVAARSLRSPRHNLIDSDASLLLLEIFRSADPQRHPQVSKKVDEGVGWEPLEDTVDGLDWTGLD